MAFLWPARGSLSQLIVAPSLAEWRRGGKEKIHPTSYRIETDTVLIYIFGHQPDIPGADTNPTLPVCHKGISWRDSAPQETFRAAKHLVL